MRNPLRMARPVERDKHEIAGHVWRLVRMLDFDQPLLFVVKGDLKGKLGCEAQSEPAGGFRPRALIERHLLPAAKRGLPHT